MYLVHTKLIITTIFIAVLMLSTTCATGTEDYGMVVFSGAKAGDLELAPCEIFLEGDEKN